MYAFRCPGCPSRVSLRVDATPICDICHEPMAKLADDQRAVLPMDKPAASLVPAKVEYLRDAGILLPETQHALDWLWRNRTTNGYDEAFTYVGGRRCIDLVAFARIARSKPT